MKEIIRRYTQNGNEIRVVKYIDDGKILFHVEHAKRNIEKLSILIYNTKFREEYNNVTLHGQN